MRGLWRARIARARSMPIALPPTSPVPIIRRRTARRSRRSSQRAASSATRSSRVTIIREELLEDLLRLRLRRGARAVRLEHVLRLLELPVPQVVARDRVEPPVGEAGEHLGEGPRSR